GPRGPGPADDLDPVEARHLVIDDQEIDRRRRQAGDGIFATREPFDRMALQLEHLHTELHDRALVVHHHDVHGGDQRPVVQRPARRSLYSMESTSACQEASMMLSATPTVPHVSSPSPEVISTRVLAAVPFDSSRMRTL